MAQPVTAFGVGNLGATPDSSALVYDKVFLVCFIPKPEVLGWVLNTIFNV
jgi:hypothetical protein